MACDPFFDSFSILIRYPIPKPRTPLPHYSLRFAQPFIVLAGIAPGYTPDQILAALYQHDQLAIQTAQTEGYRPPIPIAEHIHLVVCGPGSLDPRPLNAGQPPPPALIAGSSSLTLVYKFPNSPQHLQSSHLAQATDDQPSPSVKTATTPAPSVRLQHATPPPKTNTFCAPTHMQRPLESKPTSSVSTHWRRFRSLNSTYLPTTPPLPLMQLLPAHINPPLPHTHTLLTLQLNHPLHPTPPLNPLHPFPPLP